MVRHVGHLAGEGATGGVQIQCMERIADELSLVMRDDELSEAKKQNVMHECMTV
jgi:hypothetical protein